MDPTIYVNGEQVDRDLIDVQVSQGVDPEPYLEVGFNLGEGHSHVGVRIEMTRDQVVKLLQEMNRVEAFSLAWDAATDVLLDRGLIAEK
jgi:hypothetical protein